MEVVRKWIRGPYLSAAFVVVAVLLPARAADPQWTVTGSSVPELSRIDDAMQSFMMQRDVRQGAVAIARHGRLVYSRGFTWAVPGYPITERDTVFRIASVSKPITSILIHQLIEENVISYDTKVVEYLGLEPPPGRSLDPRLSDATVDHLLRHTGGWDRNQSFDPMFYDAQISSSLGVSRPITKYDIATYMNGEILQSAPGERYAYSNYGYSLLGMIIEKATGLDYTEAVRQRVFAPLGVTRPRLGHQLRSEWSPDEAIYESGSDRYNQENLDSHGGWVLAAPDMVRLLTILDHMNDNPLLERSSFDAMFDVGVNPTYARGWEVWQAESNGLKAYGHSGRLAPGMRSQAGWFGGDSTSALDGVSVFVVVTRNDADPSPYLLEALLQVSSWPEHDLFESVGIGGALRHAAPVESWIQIAGRADGDAGSHWRSDLALLNRSALRNKVRVRYYDSASHDLEIDLEPRQQVVIHDVTTAAGGQDFGPLRIFGSDAVTASSRTYNDSPDGTFGQLLGQVTPGTGLRTGESAVLPALRENEAFRTNIGIHNAGRRTATVRVALHDAAGTKLAEVERSVRANATLQLNAPFATEVSRNDIDSGYAVITIVFGDDVTAYASVVDRGTNDPTTIPMRRGPGSKVQWIAAAAHISGAQGSEWRTDVTILNLEQVATTVALTLRTDGGDTITTELDLAPGQQVILDDFVALLVDGGSGSIRIDSEFPVTAMSRTYDVSAAGTFGQFIDATASGASQGDLLFMPQLRHDAEFRTNLGFLNTGSSRVDLRITLHDGDGTPLGSAERSIGPEMRLQIGSAFIAIAGVESVENGYATVEVLAGAGLQAFASVVDNRTNDPTTIPGSS